MEDNIINLRKQPEEGLKKELPILEEKKSEVKKKSLLSGFKLNTKTSKKTEEENQEYKSSEKEIKISLLLELFIKKLYYLLVFALPLFILPLTIEIYEFNKSNLLFTISGLIFIVWLVKMILIDRKVKIARNAIDFSVLIFIILVMTSSFFSVDKVSSLIGFYGRFSDSLMVYVSLVMLYFTGVNVFSKEFSKKFIENILKIFFISSFLVVLVSVVYAFGFKFIPWQEAQFRYFNLIGSFSSSLGVYLVPSVIFALYFLNNSKSLFFKYASLVFILLSVLLLALIDFMLSWIVLAFCLIFLLLIPKLIQNQTRVSSFAVMVIIFVSFVFSVSSLSFLNKDNNDINFESSAISTFLNKNSNDVRDVFSKEIILDRKTSLTILTESLKDRLVLGSGPGTYLYNFSKFKPIEFNDTKFWALRFDKAGSEILEKFSTIGILGTFSYFLILIFTILMSLQVLIQGKNKSFFFVFASWFSLLLLQIFFIELTVTKFLFWLFTLIIVLYHNELSSKKNYIQIDLRKSETAYHLFSIALLSVSLVLFSSFYFQFKFYVADASYKNIRIKQNEILSDDDLIDQIVWGMLNENVNQMNREVVQRNSYRGEYRLYLSDVYMTRAMIAFREENQKQENEVDVNRIITETNNAINNLRDATDLSPNSVIYQHKFGSTYVAIGTELGIPAVGVRAVEKYQKAIELEPTNPLLHNELGKIYAISNENDLAEAEFKKALEVKKNYIDVNLQLAQIYQKKGENQKAVDEIKKISVGTGINESYAFQIGMIYYNAEEIEKAKGVFLQLVKFNFKNPNTHYVLGSIYEKQGEFETALNEFEIALSFNPDNPYGSDVSERIENLKNIIDSKNKKSESEPIVEDGNEGEEIDMEDKPISSQVK
ncbi:MAG: tetratricopeptide repeat protein [Patescibacteria group bacterium]|nr:tetratricopeptide repeat protein [Patescibacteria group bacterium]